ncbi:MAG: RES domain-containing protein [Burkholderiales bacterium]
MEGPDMLFTKVEGIFYRAVDPAYRAYALSGSRNEGRYSSITQPTLYLSASRDGVAAAMQSHKGNRSSELGVVRVHVLANRIVDLRNPFALSAMGLASTTPQPLGRRSLRRAGHRGPGRFVIASSLAVQKA